MKNTAKILLFVLLFATLFSVVAIFSACGPSWTGLHCELSEDGTYYIVTGVQAFGNIIAEYEIADTYKGLPVKAIGDKAFTTYWSAMKKIILPSTLEYIGDFAFMDCDNLESIVIPEGVTYIGASAFYDCDSLTDVSVPVSVMHIGDEAFYQCPNLNYYTSNDAKYLGNEGAQRMILADTLSDQIEAYQMDSGTAFVGSYAFADCKNLREVAFPFNLRGIGGWAFANCERLAQVSFENNTVAYIGDYAFYNCVELTSAYIENGTTTLGSGVFEGCAKLQDVVMSDRLTSVGLDIFKGCANIKYTLFDNGWYLGNERNSYAMLAKTVQGYVDTFVIHPDTKVILDYAMQACKMKRVTIPSGVVFMGQGAFHYCDSLVSLTFEENSKLTEILPSTFSYCKSLPSIQLPDGITKIGGAAFSKCDSVTHIVIPEGVKVVDNNAFADCPNLESVQLPSSLQKLGEGLFVQCPKFSTIYFNGAKAQWKQLDKDNWDKLDYNQYLSGYKVECSDGIV